MIDKEEFKTWLEHPCTKLFQDILQKKRDEFFQAAAHTSYHGYYQNEKNPNVTLLFGKVDGFDTVLGVFNDCHDQIKEERKSKDMSEEEKSKIQIDDVVGDFMAEAENEK